MVKYLLGHLIVSLLALKLVTSQNCSPENSNCHVVKNYTDCGHRGGNPVYSALSCGLERIVGGCPAAPGELPWLCALLHNNQFRCSATLLYTNPAIVLTAAHCVKDGHRDMDPSSLLLLCGVHNLTSDLTFDDPGRVPSSLDILEVVAHEDYDHVDNLNDIALIKAEDKNIFLDKNSVYPICFPSKDESYASWNHSLAAGWGANYTGGPHTVGPPRKVQVVPVSDTNCNDVMDAGIDRIKPGMMCAGGQQGRDSCQGDSGGPLMSSADGVTWALTGIISFGNQCGLQGEYGVYTRVSDYLDWIETKFKSDEDDHISKANPVSSVEGLLDEDEYTHGDEYESDQELTDQNNMTNVFISDPMNNNSSDATENVTGIEVENDINGDEEDNITISDDIDDATDDDGKEDVIISDDTNHNIDNGTNKNSTDNDFNPYYKGNISYCDSCSTIICDFQCGNDNFLSFTIGVGAAAIFLLMVILMVVCSRGGKNKKEPEFFPPQNSPFATSLTTTLSQEMRRKSSRLTKQSSFESTSRRKDEFLPPHYPPEIPRFGAIPSSTFTSFSTSVGGSVPGSSVSGGTFGSFTGQRSIPASFMGSRISPVNTNRSGASKTSQSPRSRSSQYDVPFNKSSQYDSQRSKVSQFNTMRSKTSHFDTNKSMDYGPGMVNDSRRRIMNDNQSVGSSGRRPNYPVMNDNQSVGSMGRRANYPIMNDNQSVGSRTRTSSFASRVLPVSRTSSFDLGDWKEASLPGSTDSRRKKMQVVPIPGQERVDIVLRDRTSQDSTDEREGKSAEADMDIGGKFEGMLDKEKREKILQENIYEEPTDSLLMTTSYASYTSI